MSRKRSSIGRHDRKGSDRKVKAKDKDHAAARDAAAARAKRREAYAAKQAAAEAMADLSSPPATRRPAAVETPHTVSSEEAALRRQTIIYWYLYYGKPSKSKWGGAGGTLALIRFHLAMPSTADVRWIKRVLQNYVDGEPLAKHGGGRKRKLSRGEALVAAECLERGVGREQTAHVLTARRELKGLGAEASVSSKAVRTGFNSLGGVTNRRGTTSTGSRDPTSAWAKSRFAQAEQFMRQVMPPEEPAAAGARRFSLVGTRAKVTSLSDDPLGVIGKESVSVRGSWWLNQSAAVKKAAWPCALVGYVASFKFSNGDVEPMYIIEEKSQELCYPMRVSDVQVLLPKRLQSSGRSVHTDLGRIPLEAIGWLDEKHKKIAIGSYAAKTEYRIPRKDGDPNGEAMSIAEGGKLPPRQPRKKAKFEGDGGRFCFGVMMKRGADGGLEGHKLKEPFNYSDTTLVGLRSYRERERAELKRVANLEHKCRYDPVGWGKEGLGISEATAKRPGGRYQVRYPKTWRAELRAACAKTVPAKEGEHPKLVGMKCVTELMDSVVAEFTRLFAGTPYADTFVLFHDALTEWWEADAQQYLLETHGIGPTRQLCCQGETNDLVAKRYVGKLVGDSPELCPLDSNLFSYFETAMARNIAHTYRLEHDNPEKFLVGTSDQVQNTMLRTWKVSPTSEEIVRDICRFPAALEAIIEAKGAKVPKLDNRQGRRRPKAAYYKPPSCPAAEAMQAAMYDKWDPMP